MDLPPNIPTSFVPQSASATARRSRIDLTGAFGLLAYGVLGIVFILAAGVFFYDRVLISTERAKSAELDKARDKIDLTTVAQFVQLRNRLTSGATLLENHVALSGFFTALEAVLPTAVRFSSLNLTLDSAKKVILKGSGTAKSFNTLAAASTAFAKEGKIKDAIFSNIVINRDNTVSFAFSASLDPSLVAFSAGTAAATSSQGSASTTPPL